MKVAHTEKVGNVSQTIEIEFLELTDEVKEFLRFLKITEEETKQEEIKPKRDLGDFKLLGDN